MGPAAIVAGKLLAVLAKSCVWPVGQAVKTRPFHGCNMGSIPVRVTKQKHLLQMWQVFFYCIAYKDANHVGDPYGNRTARAARPSSRAATTPLRGVAGCIWQIKSAGKFAEKQRIQGARPQPYLMYGKGEQRSRRCFSVELDSADDLSETPLGAGDSHGSPDKSTCSNVAGVFSIV